MWCTEVRLRWNGSGSSLFGNEVWIMAGVSKRIRKLDLGCSPYKRTCVCVCVMWVWYGMAWHGMAWYGVTWNVLYSFASDELRDARRSNKYRKVCTGLWYEMCVVQPASMCRMGVCGMGCGCAVPNSDAMYHQHYSLHHTTTTTHCIIPPLMHGVHSHLLQHGRVLPAPHTWNEVARGPSKAWKETVAACRCKFDVLWGSDVL